MASKTTLYTVPYLPILFPYSSFAVAYVWQPTCIVSLVQHRYIYQLHLATYISTCIVSALYCAVVCKHILATYMSTCIVSGGLTYHAHTILLATYMSTCIVSAKMHKCRTFNTIKLL